MSSNGSVKAYPLFLGLTRPPMFLGVSFTFFALEVMVAMVGFVYTSEFKYIVIAVPIHAVGYYLALKEPLFIELFQIKSAKCSKRINSFYHRANSYDMF